MKEPYIFKPEEFYRRWRDTCLRSMTLIERLPQGNLYSYKEFSCEIWVVVGDHSVMVAYQWFEDAKQIADRVHKWQEHLDARAVPRGDLSTLGQPVYGARKDPDTGLVTTVWLHFGDWAGFALALKRLPNHRTQLPRGWPESFNDRIHELLLQRTDEPVWRRSQASRGGGSGRLAI